MLKSKWAFEHAVIPSILFHMYIYPRKVLLSQKDCGSWVYMAAEGPFSSDENMMFYEYILKLSKLTVLQRVKQFIWINLHT